jgi:hypothetical protein
MWGDFSKKKEIKPISMLKLRGRGKNVITPIKNMKIMLNK